jgi:hypothetical protein
VLIPGHLLPQLLLHQQYLGNCWILGARHVQQQLNIVAVSSSSMLPESWQHPVQAVAGQDLLQRLDLALLQVYIIRPCRCRFWLPPMACWGLLAASGRQPVGPTSAGDGACTATRGASTVAAWG